MAAERIRQQALDREAKALNTQAQDRYQGFEGQQEERTGRLTELFNARNAEQAQATAEGSTETMPASQSNIVTQETEKQLGRAKEYADQQGAALAGLRSFGDVLGELSLGTARDASYVGQIGDFKRGSSNVLPYELEAANQKGGSLKLLGDILGGVGTTMTTAGLYKNVAPVPPAPSMATVPAAGTQTIEGLGKALPQTPLRLGYAGGSAPIFSRVGSLFNPY